MAEVPAIHTQRRLELARSMLARLITPDIAAVVVGGSVGRGCADEYSDLEIGLVWRQSPSPSTRRSLIEGFGPVDDDTVFLGGNSMSDGFKVDVIHATLQNVEGALANERDCRELREFLWTCVPLHATDAVRAWLDALRSQFEADWADTMARHVSRLTRTWRQAESAPLDDCVACRGYQAGIISALVCALCVAHHERPSDKWLRWSIAQTADCYADLPRRMSEALRVTPNESFRLLRVICSESLDMLAAQKPEIDLDGVREAIVNTRPGRSPQAVPAVTSCRPGERDDLIRKEVDLPWFAYNRAIFYAARGEPVFFWQEMRSYADFVVRTLCLANHLSPPPQDIPHLLHCCPHLVTAPADLRARLQTAMFAPPAEALDIMHGLIEETFDVLEAHVKQVDCAASRHAFRNDRRKTWHELPPV